MILLVFLIWSVVNSEGHDEEIQTENLTEIKFPVIPADVPISSIENQLRNSNTHIESSGTQRDVFSRQPKNNYEGKGFRNLAKPNQFENQHFPGSSQRQTYSEQLPQYLQQPGSSQNYIYPGQVPPYTGASQNYMYPHGMPQYPQQPGATQPQYPGAHMYPHVLPQYQQQLGALYSCINPGGMPQYTEGLQNHTYPHGMPQDQQPLGSLQDYFYPGQLLQYPKPGYLQHLRCIRQHIYQEQSACTLALNYLDHLINNLEQQELMRKPKQPGYTERTQNRQMYEGKSSCTQVLEYMTQIWKYPKLPGYREESENLEQSGYSEPTNIQEQQLDYPERTRNSEHQKSMRDTVQPEYSEMTYPEQSINLVKTRYLDQTTNADQSDYPELMLNSVLLEQPESSRITEQPGFPEQSRKLVQPEYFEQNENSENSEYPELIINTELSRHHETTRNLDYLEYPERTKMPEQLGYPEQREYPIYLEPIINPVLVRHPESTRNN